MVQSSEQAPFPSKVAGLILATDICKRVSQCSAESRGSSLGAPVSFHREG